jgi:hypothetical protein
MQALKNKASKAKNNQYLKKKTSKLLHVTGGSSQTLQCKDTVSMKTRDKIQKAEWVSG